MYTELNEEFLLQELTLSMEKSKYKGWDKIQANLVLKSILEWCMVKDPEEWIKLLSPTANELHDVSIL